MKTKEINRKYPFGRIRKYKNEIFLSLFTLTICILFVFRNGTFGSNVDWISQHSTIPDYFRQNFYATGDLFPQFAWNIGGGQNLFNFAYYGLYNPIILVSYLLPSLKMGDYLMFASLLLLVFDVLLFYKWLEMNHFTKKICLCIACTFLLAAPMIYHSWNQIMFVDYMPFELLALIGVNRYFDSGKQSMILWGTFLMILTSFYFSIGGILAIVLYGIYLSILKNQKITLKQFLLDGLQFVFPILMAILLAAFLLVPVACSLMQARTEKASIALSKKLIPDFNIKRYFYSPYGLGLSPFALVCLLAALFFRKHAGKEWILALGLLVLCSFPVFSYLLNGGLYLRNKVFIPLLPLFCFIMACYFKRLKQTSNRSLLELIPYLLVLLLIFIFQNQLKNNPGFLIFLMVEISILVVLFLLYMLFHYEKIIMIPLILTMLVINGFLQVQSPKQLRRDHYDHVTDERYTKLVESIPTETLLNYRMEQHGIPKEDFANINRILNPYQSISSIYSSSYNEDYKEFLEKTFDIEKPFRGSIMESVSRNPIFEDLMGVRFIISTDQPFGYQVYKNDRELRLWQNTSTRSVCYTTKDLMSEAQYKKLKFPENQIALSQSAVVKDNTLKEQPLKGNLQKIDLDLPLKPVRHSRIKLPSHNTGDLLFLQFEVKNLSPKEDVSITIEKTRNKLSASSHLYYNKNTVFTYVFGLDQYQKDIEIIHTSGNYQIKNVKSYLYSPKAEDEDQKNFDEAQILSKDGSSLEAISSSGNSDYFVTSIPYDENFKAFVDDKPVQIEKVNTAFLGFKIEKGDHMVRLVYQAPGAKAGRMISLITLLFLTFFYFIKRRFNAVILSY